MKLSAVRELMIARHTYDLSAMSPNRRVVGREPGRGGGPGAVLVVPPETRDLVGLVSAIDVPERIRDQLEAE